MTPPLAGKGQPFRSPLSPSSRRTSSRDWFEVATGVGDVEVVDRHLGALEAPRNEPEDRSLPGTSWGEDHARGDEGRNVYVRHLDTTVDPAGLRTKVLEVLPRALLAECLYGWLRLLMAARTTKTASTPATIRGLSMSQCSLVTVADSGAPRTGRKARPRNSEKATEIFEQVAHVQSETGSEQRPTGVQQHHLRQENGPDERCCSKAALAGGLGCQQQGNEHEPGQEQEPAWRVDLELGSPDAPPGQWTAHGRGGEGLGAHLDEVPHERLGLCLGTKPGYEGQYTNA